MVFPTIDSENENRFRYGFIDRNGKVAITPQYTFALPFSEGLAAILIEEKIGYIDKSGNMVIPPKFETIQGPGFFFDKPKRPIFEHEISFSEGMAAIVSDNKWGYTDKTGEVVIQPIFDRAFQFKEGIARVEIGNKIGYIDKAGNYIWNLQN